MDSHSMSLKQGSLSQFSNSCTEHQNWRPNFSFFQCWSAVPLFVCPIFSTETALLWVVNDLPCSVNGSKVVPLTLLDVSAAFDKISCDLAATTATWGRKWCQRTQPVLAWFSSYLPECYHHVKVNLEVSANMYYKVVSCLVLFLSSWALPPCKSEPGGIC